MSTIFHAALVEEKMQGPILMEAEMETASEEAVTAAIRRGNWQRACVVCCQYVGGNRLLFDAMVTGAERHQLIRNDAKREEF